MIDRLAGGALPVLTLQDHAASDARRRGPAEENVIIVLCPTWILPSSPRQRASRAEPAFGPARSWTETAWRIALAAPVILTVGCEARRPDFLEVIQRNCDHGDAEACDMLASVNPPDSGDADIAPPVHSREIVEAILAGMRQSRQNYARHYQQAPVPLADPDRN